MKHVRSVRAVTAFAAAALASAHVLAVPAVCSGDVNGDGRTNVSDFNILASNFGAGPGSTRAQGDLSGDGFINVSDFNILAGNFGCVVTTRRVMTWNVEDVRTPALLVTTDPKLKEVAEVIQILRPDVLLLNEVAYDMPGEVIGAPGPGLNGQRLADNYLAIGQNGQLPLSYTAVMYPSNTGIHSGKDLDNDGVIDPTPFSFDYGNDCYGFGDYPGQYALTVLVRTDLVVQTAQARTFQNFLWNQMPGYLAATLVNPPFLGGGPYYSPDELAILRLSSKSHWDVPVVMPDGSTLHVLASHPTPPVFDGLEDRNGRRNHDEIRFWGDYLDNDPYFVDDNGGTGGLSPTAQFVIMGDMNADTNEGDSYNNPIAAYFQFNPRIQYVTPLANLDLTANNYDNDDTAFFRYRVDYVLPSTGLFVRATGIERIAGSFTPTDGPSDHWPVWLDLDFLTTVN